MSKSKKDLRTIKTDQSISDKHQRKLLLLFGFHLVYTLPNSQMTVNLVKIYVSLISDNCNETKYNLFIPQNMSFIFCKQEIILSIKTDDLANEQKTQIKWEICLNIKTLRLHCIKLCFRDIDECQDNNGKCTQECNNSPGSYSCSCRSGYKLHADQKTCLGNLFAFLLISLTYSVSFNLRSELCCKW